MTLSRQQSVFTYSSSSGGETYYFDIVVDSQGLVFARNIRKSTGTTTSSSEIPESVLNDISSAKDIVQQMVGETQVDSGNVVFTGQTENSVAIPAGILNNTSYRVVYTPPDDTLFMTEDQTTTSFTAKTATTYGSVADPKTVGYVVLVSTQQAGVTSGTLTFTDADSGQKSVVFATAFTTDEYHVVLSEDGFFSSKVVTQTKTGFILELGYTLGAGLTADVGYDIFVS